MVAIGAKPPLTVWIWLLAFAQIALHLWNDPAYGYFRDELYYIACSERLAWGYVDHPPLSIAILAATRALLGDGMLAIRVPVILAGAATTVIIALLTRAFGGGAFAQALAALGFTVMPVMLVMGSFFSMNAFDVLFWVVAAYLIVRLVERDRLEYWLLLGAVVGLGLLNKYSVGFFVGAVVAGLVLTRQRRLLLTPRFWIAGALAALIFLPHIAWQIVFAFPTLEFMRNATELKNVAMSPGDFLGAQVLYTNPANVLIWLVGLAALLFARFLQPFRSLGIAYLALVALFILQHGKPYYLAPTYPMLLAAGAATWERFSARRGRRWLRPLLVALVLLLGLVTLPITLPILPPQDFVRYAQAIGVEAPQEERGRPVELPQPFADRFGWENQVATVARVYSALTPEERAQVVIVTRNYGEAGAIDFLGQRHGLPTAVSGHNNYWLWGPGTTSGEVAITIGLPRDQLAPFYEEITLADTIVSPYAMAHENNQPVFLCRKLKQSLAEVWKELKRFI